MRRVVRWSSAVLAVLLASFATSSCTERFSPSNRYLSCMEDAGYELVEISSHFSEETGDLILGVDIHDPQPSEQTPEMLAQSEECILQVNGGVRPTTVPTTIPGGLAGDFTICIREAGYDIHEVEVEEIAGGGLSISHIGEDEIPENVFEGCVAELEEKLGLP